MNRWQKAAVLVVGAAVLLGGVFWLGTRLLPTLTRSSGGRVLDASPAEETAQHLLCVGRIEAVGGEVDVAAAMNGTIESILVKEGDRVETGALLAVVDARREKAHLDLAQARLARVQAGSGAEEIAATAAQRDALAAELVYAESEAERARKLKATEVVSDGEAEARLQRADSLRKQVAGLQKQWEAMKRGPLPEEIAVARAEVELARAQYALAEVRAPSAGTVLQLYRHAGDIVLMSYPTPILRLADTTRLQVRVEVNEADVYRVKPGTEGAFTVVGMQRETGRLRVAAILPAFTPKRLFDPDTSVRVDTRTLQVLAEIIETGVTVYSGQRVTVAFTVAPP
jgi:multidrug efflux pump subunit AcrA (membrane-fusion protein)